LYQLLIRGYEGGWHRRRIFRYWNELEKSQWLSRDALLALQFDRLRQFLLHVQATSPWYGDTWRFGGLDARAVARPEDFLRWPVIDRDTVRTHRMAMRTTAPGVTLMAKATGGSSGVPLQFDLDMDGYDRRIAAWHRGYNWAGAAPGTRQWYLWGVAPHSAGSWAHRKARLYDRLYRRTTASCFELSDANVLPFLASLRRTRPHVIVAYTNAIYTFARMLESRSLVPFSPGSIVVGAEKLHDYQRETIERVFQAPVFETYGSREFTLMGAECDQHTGLHLTAENLIIEVLDDDGQPVAPGTDGNVVVTDLTNLGMPFIRYATGDRAVARDGACPCGRALPQLARVTGRRLDMLTTSDGRRLPGEFFPHIIKELASVQRFQVVQERRESVTVRLVAPAWREADAAWLRAEVAAVVGTALHVDIEVVSEIPLTAAGKLQVVVNRIDAPPPIGESR
jgi:phenylacetate-CoA ligase